jgi:hypothetical protein
MQYYEQALKLLEIVPTEKQKWFGGVPEKIISAFEQEIGCPIPPSYRRFLLEYGSGSVYSLEFDGMEKSGALDLYSREILDFCRSEGRPPIIKVHELGEGTFYGLDLSRSEAGESPVVGWHASIENGMDFEAGSFGEFFLIRIQEICSVVRE